MNIKLIWYALLILQIALYSFFQPIHSLRPSATVFMLFLSLSCGVSAVLIYVYVSHRNNNEVSKMTGFLLFMSSAITIVLLTLLLGELIFVVDLILLISFMVVLVLTGKKLVFARNARNIQ